MPGRSKNSNRGFTLIELVVVVAIIAIIAGFAVSRFGVIADRAKVVAAQHDLMMLRDAFVNPESGYIRDLRGIPGFSLGYLRVANLLISTNLYGAAEAYPSGVRVDDVAIAGCAAPEVFTAWDGESERGWRGPYLKAPLGEFPTRGDSRFNDDASFEGRGFYPSLVGLRMPQDFLVGRDDCSVYGFPGEPAVMDPWGNPYVLQIPPPQAFPGSNTNLAEEARFRFARVVSAGPDGRLDTPCFHENTTNRWETSWNEQRRRRSRQAGRYGADVSARGDDLVLFLIRNDTDEGDDEE